MFLWKKTPIIYPKNVQVKSGKHDYWLSAWLLFDDGKWNLTGLILSRPWVRKYSSFSLTLNGLFFLMHRFEIFKNEWKDTIFLQRGKVWRRVNFMQVLYRWVFLILRRHKKSYWDLWHCFGKVNSSCIDSGNTIAISFIYDH